MQIQELYGGEINLTNVTRHPFVCVPLLMPFQGPQRTEDIAAMTFVNFSEMVISQFVPKIQLNFILLSIVLIWGLPSKIVLVFESLLTFHAEIFWQHFSDFNRFFGDSLSPLRVIF